MLYCVLVMFVHNHPSGNSEASEDDMKLTKRLSEAGEIVVIDVLDHIIIVDKNYLSMKIEGLFLEYLCPHISNISSNTPITQRRG